MLNIEATQLEVWHCQSTFATVGELQIPAKANANVTIDNEVAGRATITLSIRQQDREISTFTLGVRRRAS